LLPRFSVTVEDLVKQLVYVKVLFEVNEQDFKVIYVNAIDEDLIKENEFYKVPKIISST
jgi:hypothetical protein